MIINLSQWQNHAVIAEMLKKGCSDNLLVRTLDCYDVSLTLMFFKRSSVKSGEMARLTQFVDNEVFRAFATYATIVVLKMMLMSVTTAYFRLTRKVRNWECCLVE